MLFYTGEQFPKRYQGGLFIAFHGSRFDASLQPAGPGYMVTFTRWEANRPHRNYQEFAEGFAGAVATPTDAEHRPLGLAQMPDGSLLVGDDKQGFIWRIWYTKPK
jgi:glucose/arabinose dehydrogenase